MNIALKNKKNFKSEYSKYIQNIKPSDDLIKKTLELANKEQENLQQSKEKSSMRVLYNINFKKLSALACTLVFAIFAVKLWNDIDKQPVPVKPNLVADTTTDTSITSKTTETPPENHFDDKPQDKPSDYTEYEGNLARNTIYVRVNKDGDIQRISYQYFESGDNISLEQTVGEIIKSGSMEGKVEIDDIKFRYAVFNKGDSSGYDVIFLDRAIEISTLNRLLIIFISIGSLGLLILFGVSWLLAS